MRREYVLIVLITLYSLFSHSGHAVAGRSHIQAKEVLQEVNFDFLHNATYTVPAFELVTSGGVDLQSRINAVLGLVREWDSLTIKHTVKCNAVRRCSSKLLLPFDKPDIVYPFHFFK